MYLRKPRKASKQKQAQNPHNPCQSPVIFVSPRETQNILEHKLSCHVLGTCVDITKRDGIVHTYVNRVGLVHFEEYSISP